VSGASASRTAVLIGLALIFTLGLGFASVELPRVVDGFLQKQVTTPGFDSQADEVSRLKTELFIAHYHLRTLGYLCFGGLILLIAAGFATARAGWAALGGVALMLPVFAQFASVMFFLAGLGLLNVLWLPVLDVSFDLGVLGEIARAPYDAALWLGRRAGLRVARPLVYLFVTSGLLVFFLGTFAWLRTRARGQAVADSWVYRFCRHPQYLGWILWSYGLYLLTLQGRYPKRSWGISAALPWLVSSLVIVGVALVEELGMRARHGDAYEAYRRSAPFMVPLPRALQRLLAAPLRMLFGTDWPTRRREVVAVLGLYLVLLMTASFLFYGGGAARIQALVRPAQDERAEVARLAHVLQQRPEGRWRDQAARELALTGDAALPTLLELLADDNASVRALAARAFVDRPDPRALPGLAAALSDEAEAVRSWAQRALGALGSPEAIAPLLTLLDDPVLRVRLGVVQTLAGLGAAEILEPAAELLGTQEAWARAMTARALGTLGSEAALPLLTRGLQDDSAWVRQEAVVALLRIGSRQALPVLEQALSDEDWEVRLYAAEAVERLSSGG
jgi:protein-S-isoprenylcysteine O-methyltransferase Ste14